MASTFTLFFAHQGTDIAKGVNTALIWLLLGSNEPSFDLPNLRRESGFYKWIGGEVENVWSRILPAVHPSIHSFDELCCVHVITNDEMSCCQHDAGSLSGLLTSFAEIGIFLWWSVDRVCHTPICRKGCNIWCKLSHFFHGSRFNLIRPYFKLNNNYTWH